MIPLRPASRLLTLLALSASILLAGCTSLKSISILPTAGVVLTGIGQTAQFTAYGASQMGTAAATTSNITTSVTWTVSNPSVATINSSGVATAVGAGTTSVNAESGGLIATSSVIVTLGSGSSGGSGTPSIGIIPTTAAETFIGETTQFLANGSPNGGASQDLTTQVQWISSNAQVATISSGGLATALSSGTTEITAQYGGLNASATLTVTISGASATPTLTIIPSAGATASFTGETTQFIALGNLSGGSATQNLTSNVTWSSSDVSLATIDKNGLATDVGANTVTESTTITAIGTTSTGSLITATSSLTVPPTGGVVNLPALAVYLAGTGTGTVTSSPGTIACGSPAAGSSCTGNFTLNTIVTLTATPAVGSVFGGWSSNCVAAVGNPNPLVCNVQMNNNETVGAVFNP